MSLGHVMLGLLSAGPAHGYDLKRHHDAWFPSARTLAYGQVYATLTRLERDRLIEVVETGRDGGPERRVYAITDLGTAELESWLGTVEPPGPYPADELVRKVVTAMHLHEDAAGFVRRQRAGHLARMRELVNAQSQVDEPTARIEFDHTVAHLDADLRWLETAQARAGELRRGSR